MFAYQYGRTLLEKGRGPKYIFFSLFIIISGILMVIYLDYAVTVAPLYPTAASPATTTRAKYMGPIDYLCRLSPWLPCHVPLEKGRGSIRDQVRVFFILFYTILILFTVLLLITATTTTGIKDEGPR
jgi:hypothetical protein